MYVCVCVPMHVTHTHTHTYSTHTHTHTHTHAHTHTHTRNAYPLIVSSFIIIRLLLRERGVVRKQELTQRLFSPYFHVQAPEPPVEKAAIPPEFTAMVATFDGLKDQIKAVASSPVSPTPVTADGRAADPFLALNQFCTCIYVLYVSDHKYVARLHLW